MSVITVFGGIFCNDEATVRDVMESTGYRLITDDMVTVGAAKLSGIKKSKIKRAFSSKTSVFNKFTHEKESYIAYLKLALAQMLEQDNIIVSGYASLLIPGTISHVLRVCMIAKTAFRVDLAKKERNLTEKEAARIISREDHDRAVWTETLLLVKDPWDPALYDIVLPMGKTGPDKAGALIQENLLKDAVKRTHESKEAVKDFLLAAKTEVALALAGHNVMVEAAKGEIILTINKHVLMLGRLEEELKSIAGEIPGVRSVETRVGQAYHQSNIYRKHNIEVPSKVLLVDDEREFAQTLSERLLMRDMGSAVAYDGKSALDLVEDDDPEVMILDLKMPGIDGMEILKKVKKTRPELEVIVLTGRGSEKDREKCMELGAFAYMQKPVDIDLLSETLKKAHEKIKGKG